MIKNIEGIIVEFIIVYLLILIAYYLIIGRTNKKYNKNKPTVEASYLTKVYNIDMTKIDYKKFAKICMFTNCLVMDIIYIIISKLLKGFVWQMIIGFILLIILIIINYGIIGKYYEKKEGNKNV